jgi:hypothetical protein
VTVQTGWLTERLEQAKRDREDALLARATHEAGHAIAAHALGGRVDWISLIPRDHRAGATCYRRPPELWDQLVVDLAGAAASEAFGWRDRACGSDESYARTHAVRIAGRDWFDHDRIESILQEGRTLSGALVRSHWKGVLSLSQQLARRLRLAGTELDSALAAALRLSPSHRAAEAAWNVEWRGVQTWLASEHARRDPFQRLLQARTATHKSPRFSSASATVAFIAPSGRSFPAGRRDLHR